MAFVRVPLLALALVLLWSCLVQGAPSSPWNQAGLNLIFKPDLKELQKSKSDPTADPDKLSSSTGAAVAGGVNGTGSSPEARKWYASHSWGYTRYGDDIGHVRHRKQKLPNHQNAPCPKNYMRFLNGKCRRIPSFGGQRVG